MGSALTTHPSYIKDCGVDKKYELTEESIEFNSHKLYRIRAIKDFGPVDAGQLGGYIQSEENLSHDGYCWVYQSARVYENARVCGNASVSGKSHVYGDAEVSDGAWVSGKSHVFGTARVYGRTKVCGNAQVCMDTGLLGSTWVCGNANAQTPEHIHYHSQYAGISGCYGATGYTSGYSGLSGESGYSGGYVLNSVVSSCSAYYQDVVSSTYQVSEVAQEPNICTVITSTGNNKYVLTGESISILGHILYRIKSLKDFNNVKADDLGGFIEHTSNLSQYGDCWVYDNAQVRGNARVFDSAQVCGNASVSGDAEVYGRTQVYDNAQVYGGVRIHGYAQVYENAQVYGNAQVFGNARVRNHACVHENAQVSGNAMVCGDAWIRGDAWLCGDDVVDHGYVSWNMVGCLSSVCKKLNLT